MRLLPPRSSYLSLLFSRQTFTVFDLMSELITKTTGFGFVWFEFFSDNGKVGLMCSKAEHNEISYQSTTTKQQTVSTLEDPYPVTKGKTLS